MSCLIAVETAPELIDSSSHRSAAVIVSCSVSRAGRPVSGDPPRRGLRLSGPERGREVDDHPAAAGPDPAHGGQRSRAGLDPRRDAVRIHAEIGYLAGDFVVLGRERVGALFGAVARDKADQVKNRFVCAIASTGCYARMAAQIGAKCHISLALDIYFCNRVRW